MAEIVVMTGAGNATPLAAAPESIKQAMSDLSPILKEIAEKIIQPAFARNYDRSGLKVRSSMLRTAVSKTGAKGNLLEIGPHSLVAGVDYSALPYAKYAIEGRGPVAARNKKALRFYDDNGKPIFVKRVKAAPPHDIIFLTEADYEKIAAYVTQKLVELGAAPITK